MADDSERRQPLKLRFYEKYLDLLPSEQKDVAIRMNFDAIPNNPFSWNVCMIEVKNNTALANMMLKQLAVENKI